MSTYWVCLGLPHLLTMTMTTIISRKMIMLMMIKVARPAQTPLGMPTVIPPPETVVGEAVESIVGESVESVVGESVEPMLRII